MILYLKNHRPEVKFSDIMVQPGFEHPGTSDFFDENGKPILFNVTFKYGESEDLPDNLARYIVDKGLAKTTRLILPG